MTFRNVVTVAAIVSVLYALCSLLLPGEFLDFIGAAGSSVLLTRWLGSAAVGLAVILWLARGVTDMGAQKAITTGMFASFGVGFLVTLMAQLGEGALASNWMNAVLFLAMSAAFGYLTFMKSGTA